MKLDSGYKCQGHKGSPDCGSKRVDLYTVTTKTGEVSEQILCTYCVESIAIGGMTVQNAL